MNARNAQRLVTLTLIAAFCIGGCAGMPIATLPPLANDVKQGLGTVGVLKEDAAVGTDFGTPHGKISGLLMGAASGAAELGAMGAWAGGPILGGVFAVLGATAGAVMGANEGLSGEQSQEAEQQAATLKDIAAESNPYDALRQRLQESAKTRTKQRLVVLENNGSPTSGQPDFTILTGAGIDTVLELSDIRIGLNAVYRRENNRVINHPNHLEVSVHTRLVRIANREVIDERDVAYRSPVAHDFIDWTVDDASLFRRELDTALTELTATIGDCLLWVVEG